MVGNYIALVYRTSVNGARMEHRYPIAALSSPEFVDARKAIDGLIRKMERKKSDGGSDRMTLQLDEAGHMRLQILLESAGINVLVSGSKSHKWITVVDYEFSRRPEYIPRRRVRVPVFDDDETPSGAVRPSERPPIIGDGDDTYADIMTSSLERQL